jgi:hypothetical protein
MVYNIVTKPETMKYPLRSTVRGTLVVITAEDATQTDLEGELFYNGRVSGKDKW